jgi:hypothetical protein
MPVTRDPRYIEICARVNRGNIKIGKAQDFEGRKRNYVADFDEQNIIFEPLYRIQDIKTAERLIKRELKSFQKLSPKGGRLEWLEGISYYDAKAVITKVIESSSLDYEAYNPAS